MLIEVIEMYLVPKNRWFGVQDFDCYSSSGKWPQFSGLTEDQHFC